MPEKKLLLIESGQFIGEVIHSLFDHHDHLNVTPAAPSTPRELLQVTKKVKPDIIVLDDTVCPDYLPILLRYMQNSAGVRVVVVNTDRNEVEVYEKQHIAVRQTADFFAIL